MLMLTSCHEGGSSFFDAKNIKTEIAAPRMSIRAQTGKTPPISTKPTVKYNIIQEMSIIQCILD